MCASLILFNCNGPYTPRVEKEKNATAKYVETLGKAH